MYNFYVTTPLYFAGNRPPGAPSWGKAHKDFQRRYFNRWIHMDSCSQDLPYGRNRVDIDPAVKDAWGVPAARLTHRFSEADHRVAETVMDREVELLKEAGPSRCGATRIRRAA